ncbi:MAG: GIY-YIG nuclease family protein [Bacillota bacterium]|nr:GIY-YIG nuclease family protein [Bacillota bacterium]
MPGAKAKTINLLLEDGTLKGLINIADSSWNSGELYSAPRDSVTELVKSDACSKFGVYLLLSDDMVYVGQASDLSRRIKQHIIGKDWWERVIVLTTSDDSFTRTDIDYMESMLIAKAEKTNKLDCDNKNKGNKPKIDKFRKVQLDQYLDEALFLMELIGITVFVEEKAKNKVKNKVLIDTIPTVTVAEREMRLKSEAKQFLSEQGVNLPDEFTFANRTQRTPEFYINPQTYLAKNDWYLVFNNQFTHELIVLFVPANQLKSIKDGGKLIPRKDKPHYYEIYVKSETMIDRKSKVDFTPYIIKKIKY